MQVQLQSATRLVSKVVLTTLLLAASSGFAQVTANCASTHAKLKVAVADSDAYTILLINIQQRSASLRNSIMNAYSGLVKTQDSGRAAQIALLSSPPSQQRAQTCYNISYSQAMSSQSYSQNSQGNSYSLRYAKEDLQEAVQQFSSKCLTQAVRDLEADVRLDLNSIVFKSAPIFQSICQYLPQ